MSPGPDADPLRRVRDLVQMARRRIHQVVYGNDETITLLLVALAAKGHMLLEGLPGVGKTTLAKTFAEVTGLQFSRVQLTPDLMPVDITGHTIFDQKDQVFKFRRGPVFTNILLADELNRTPPRTQAALLEVMQEHQVTIEGRSLKVPDPFLVIATKNPIEVEGVYKLPEAELDRFMVHSRVRYPDKDIERQLLAGKLGHNGLRPEPLPQIGPMLQAVARRVRVHADVQDYLLEVVRATRDHRAVEYGASPRASEQLQRAAQAHAAVEGRLFVIPDDIKELAYPVLRHRILLNADAEMQEVQPEDVLDEILDQVEPPVVPGRPTRAEADRATA